MNSIFTRRSVRSFLEKEVEQEKIDKILRAAMQAPSAMNQQPWEFIVVKGRENLHKLSGYNPYAGSLNSADFAIIVLADHSKMVLPEYWEQDLGAATQNILLQVTELGLGAVWLGAAPDTQRMDYIKNLYNLDRDVKPYCVISVGYPKQENANRFVDRFDPNKIRVIQ